MITSLVFNTCKQMLETLSACVSFYPASQFISPDQRRGFSAWEQELFTLQVIALPCSSSTGKREADPRCSDSSGPYQRLFSVVSFFFDRE